MKSLQIVGIVLTVLGLIGLIAGTGPVWARWVVLGLGIIGLIGGYASPTQPTDRRP